MGGSELAESSSGSAGSLSSIPRQSSTASMRSLKQVETSGARSYPASKENTPSIKDGTSSVKRVKQLGVMSDFVEDGVSRFPKLDECAHFHYDYIELGPINTCMHEDPVAHRPASAEDEDRVFYVQITCNGKTWVVRRTYENFRMLDKQLHRCVYDRKYSQLTELPKGEVLVDEPKESIKHMLSNYLARFSSISGSIISCGPILNWLEMDNRGNRLLVTDESSAINTPAVAAAHVVKRYMAQAADEISFEVGDIISVIDMPTPEESMWWRGKRGFEVGFFPRNHVELIGDKSQVPQLVRAGRLATPTPSEYSGKPLFHKHGRLMDFLRSFMTTRPSRRRLKQRGILKERVFGCDLGEHLLNYSQDVPTVLRCCAQMIENHGIVDGIYRLSGVSSNIQKLRHAFDEDRVPNLEDEEILQDIHCVASLLKMYFRELPNPLLTYQLYDKFVSAVQDEENRLFRIFDVVQQLPPPHYRTLKYLICHLAKVAAHGGETGMHCKNLAIVWAPNLLRCKELETGAAAARLHSVGVQAVVTEFLIQYCDIIFSDKMPSFHVNGVPGMKYHTSPKRTRPKSLAVSTPAAKLLSLEEARLRAICMPGNVSLPNSHQEYIDVGGGPAALPEKYHTVIELPGKKGRKPKTPVGWKTFFTMKRSQAQKGKSRSTKSETPELRGSSAGDALDASTRRKKLRSVKSADSLFTLGSHQSARYSDASEVSLLGGGVAPLAVASNTPTTLQGSSFDSPRLLSPQRSTSHESFFDDLDDIHAVFAVSLEPEPMLNKENLHARHHSFSSTSTFTRLPTDGAAAVDSAKKALLERRTDANRFNISLHSGSASGSEKKYGHKRKGSATFKEKFMQVFGTSGDEKPKENTALQVTDLQALNQPSAKSPKIEGSSTSPKSSSLKERIVQAISPDATRRKLHQSPLFSRIRNSPSHNSQNGLRRSMSNVEVFSALQSPATPEDITLYMDTNLSSPWKTDKLSKSVVTHSDRALGVTNGDASSRNLTHIDKYGENKVTGGARPKQKFINVKVDVEKEPSDYKPRLRSQSETTRSRRRDDLTSPVSPRSQKSWRFIEDDTGGFLTVETAFLDSPEAAALQSSDGLENTEFSMELSLDFSDDRFINTKTTYCGKEFSVEQDVLAERPGRSRLSESEYLSSVTSEFVLPPGTRRHISSDEHPRHATTGSIASNEDMSSLRSSIPCDSKRNTGDSSVSNEGISLLPNGTNIPTPNFDMNSSSTLMETSDEALPPVFDDLTNANLADAACHDFSGSNTPDSVEVNYSESEHLDVDNMPGCSDVDYVDPQSVYSTDNLICDVRILEDPGTPSGFIDSSSDVDDAEFCSVEGDISNKNVDTTSNEYRSSGEYENAVSFTITDDDSLPYIDQTIDKQEMQSPFHLGNLELEQGKSASLPETPTPVADEAKVMEEETSDFTKVCPDLDTAQLSALEPLTESLRSEFERTEDSGITEMTTNADGEEPLTISADFSDIVMAMSIDSIRSLSPVNTKVSDQQPVESYIVDITGYSAKDFIPSVLAGDPPPPIPLDTYPVTVEKSDVVSGIDVGRKTSSQDDACVSGSLSTSNKDLSNTITETCSMSLSHMLTASPIDESCKMVSLEKSVRTTEETCAAPSKLSPRPVPSPGKMSPQPCETIGESFVLGLFEELQHIQDVELAKELAAPTSTLHGHGDAGNTDLASSSDNKNHDTSDNSAYETGNAHDQLLQKHEKELLSQKDFPDEVTTLNRARQRHTPKSKADTEDDLESRDLVPQLETYVQVQRSLSDRIKKSVAEAEYPTVEAEERYKKAAERAGVTVERKSSVKELRTKFESQHGSSQESLTSTEYARKRHDSSSSVDSLHSSSLADTPRVILKERASDGIIAVHEDGDLTFAANGASSKLDLPFRIAAQSRRETSRSLSGDTSSNKLTRDASPASSILPSVAPYTGPKASTLPKSSASPAEKNERAAYRELAEKKFDRSCHVTPPKKDHHAVHALLARNADVYSHDNSQYSPSPETYAPRPVTHSPKSRRTLSDFGVGLSVHTKESVDSKCIPSGLRLSAPSGMISPGLRSEVKLHKSITPPVVAEKPKFRPSHQRTFSDDSASGYSSERQPFLKPVVAAEREVAPVSARIAFFKQVDEQNRAECESNKPSSRASSVSPSRRGDSAERSRLSSTDDEEKCIIIDENTPSSPDITPRTSFTSPHGVEPKAGSGISFQDTLYSFDSLKHKPEVIVAKPVIGKSTQPEVIGRSTHPEMQRPSSLVQASAAKWDSANRELRSSSLGASAAADLPKWPVASRKPGEIKSPPHWTPKLQPLQIGVSSPATFQSDGISAVLPKKEHEKEIKAPALSVPESAAQDLPKWSHRVKQYTGSSKVMQDLKKLEEETSAISLPKLHRRSKHE